MVGDCCRTISNYAIATKKKILARRPMTIVNRVEPGIWWATEKRCRSLSKANQLKTTFDTIIFMAIRSVSEGFALADG